MRVTIGFPFPGVHVDDGAVPYTPPVSIEQAIYHTVHEVLPGGVAEVAGLLNIPVGTLTHKANPNAATHHLRPDELVKLMVATGDGTILQAMAAAVGHLVVPMAPDQAGGDSREAFMHLQMEYAELIRALADPYATGKAVTTTQYKRALHHFAETLAAMVHALATLHADIPTPPKPTY